eukprot:GGOE01014860.1.p1 GENE.GGOE01014860.1~~GGOE01014860.1.p1  ORF type:complete len:559 (+),score=138.48 GGOE01014860.1:247-1677(+)
MVKAGGTADGKNAIAPQRQAKAASEAPAEVQPPYASTLPEPEKVSVSAILTGHNVQLPAGRGVRERAQQRREGPDFRPTSRWWEQPNAEGDRKWQDHLRHRAEQRETISDSIAEVPSQCYDSDYTHVILDDFTCYRVYAAQAEMHKRFDEEEGLYDLEDEELEFHKDAETGHWALPLPDVGPHFFRFIIGTKGATRDSIEKDTGATIKVPKPNDPDQFIVIRGLTRAVCAAAKQRIEIVKAKCASLLDYTHFISIPLSAAVDDVTKLVDTLNRKFSGKVKGVEPSIFQSPAQAHLTILMLRLYTPDDLACAKRLMRQVQKFVDDIFRPDDCINLKGLNYMNDDPAEVHVLYLQVGKNGLDDKILRLVDHVSQLFIQAGLATSNEIEHNEKLHATLMNSKWRSVPETPAQTGEEDKPAPRPSTRVERIPFDIRPIMAEFEAVDVGTFPLRTLDLSRLGPKDATGYWPSDETVHFPSH